MPSTGERAAATDDGWVISSGSATTVCLVTDSASTSPSRSKMAPRTAGMVTVWVSSEVDSEA